MNSLRVGIEGCRVDRVLDGQVEIVEAAPNNRTFPARVTESLGLCLKFGPDHDVTAAGRAVRFPRNSVCIRTPGCVWSSAATGRVGFLSINIDSTLLPPGDAPGIMRFFDASELPDLRWCVRLLRSTAAALTKEVVVATLIESLQRLHMNDMARIAGARHQPAVDRARDVLTTTIVRPPTLQVLADTVGMNRFVLVREFRHRFGVPPHAFVLRLRVERARSLLRRGGAISDVAQALGFADQAHLTRAFKKTLGVSPGAYRRSLVAVTQ